MREDFLHFLWRMARFDLSNLTTTTGAAIDILDFGTLNSNAGPDFIGAQLRIDGVHWVGNVEMHLRSSQWYAHEHHHDPAYENVILHVVLEEDQAVFRSNGSRIPSLEMRNRIPAGLAGMYWRLQQQENWVPCQQLIDRVPEQLYRIWLQRLLIERITRKANALQQILERNRRDWEETFFQSLAKSLGGKVNSGAMEMLARSVSLRTLLRHKHSLLQLEALLFGQAGLLPLEGEETYPQQLKREYALLANKYHLTPIPRVTWRYLRLRPANFPERRIAQLARLIHTSGQLFGKSLAAASAKELENMFAITLSNYWQQHFRFGVPGKRIPRRLGKETVRSILINTVVPINFLYGQLRADLKIQERALDILNQLPPEKNLIIRKWQALAITPSDAGESQALLELKANYCNARRCLSCSIGCKILDLDEGATGRQLREAEVQYA